MKGGLCIIYTSLLTISVISSCALFLLVVSEGLQVDTEASTTNKTVILDGLQNVTNKISTLSQNNVATLPKDEPQILETVDENPKDSVLQDHEMTFADTLSLNSVTTDGLPDTGQPPILISLSGSAKLQLKKEDDLLYVNDSEQHNDTKTRLLVETKKSLETEKKETIDNLVESNKETLVVQAKPIQEAKQAEEPAAPSIVAAATEDIESQDNDTAQNETTTNIPVKAEIPQEDIPSFSEWAQKQLAEAEKKDTVLNHSSQPSHNNVNISNKSTKLRSKNYASPACGAKIVAVNPEAGSASSILSPNRDEYMLNTCNSRIWFVVELCEPVQAQKIEIANFELFSSIPKDFAVFFSDRFPTREWASVGQFTAKDLRDVQSFDLFPHMFGKFIKVEMNSYYGSEHYCPISLFKVYGTSEFEVLEKENAQHAAHVEDDDEILDVPDVPTAEASKNLFGSARDAVMSIMKKAAQVLVKSEVPRNASSQMNDTTENMYKHCCSPSHIIVCDNCSQSMYNEVHDLISCNANELTNLISHVFIRNTLKCTKICQPFGLDFKSTKTITFSHHRVRYMEALFRKTYLAAMCNILAIQEKKVVLNTSFETEHNATTNLTLDKAFNISEDKVAEEAIQLPTNSTSDANVNTSETTEFENETVTKEASSDANTESLKNKENAEIKNDEPTPVVTEKSDEKTKVDMDKEAESVVKENLEIKDDKKGLDDKDDLKSKGIYAKEEKNVKDAGNAAEENEQLFIDNESFLSEFDQLTVDPTPPGTPTQNNQQSQTIQKESVFLRLSNRVKTLERNMSLSGQYLEELSRRYKKQVEEMQKSFEKTIQQMAEERQKSNEKEQRYAEQMTSMEEQIAQMAAAMKLLMDERDSWFGNVTFFKFLLLQTFTIAAVIYYIRKRKRPEPIIIPVHKKISKNRRNQDKFRRKSVEGVSGHETPSAKKRRPSEEALQIARQSTENIDAADDDGEWQVARRGRRRKTSILHRNLEEKKHAWCRQDSIGELQENPISLDEQEFIAPVPEPVVFAKLVPSKEPKTNGSLFNNLKAKTMKTRRLSSPAFLRTLSRQSSRSAPVKSEFKVNGKARMSSESPTSSLWSESTEVSQINGQCDSASVAKTKKKSFKNIFRKVF